MSNLYLLEVTVIPTRRRMQVINTQNFCVRNVETRKTVSELTVYSQSEYAGDILPSSRILTWGCIRKFRNGTGMTRAFIHVSRDVFVV